MNPFRKNFCHNIRYLRQKHHLTQKEMAQAMGISVKTLRKIENCDPSARINAAILCRLCDHFCLSIDGVLRERME